LVMAGIYYFDPGRRQQAQAKKNWQNVDDRFPNDADMTSYVKTVHRDDTDEQSQHVQARNQQTDDAFDDETAAVSESLNQTHGGVHSSELVNGSNSESAATLQSSEAFDGKDEQTAETELASPFNDGFDAKVDSELEINAALLEPLDDPDKDAENASGENEATEAPSIIMLHLVATDGLPYQGKVISDAFMKASLRYGSMEIYHYVDAQQDRELFSVANIREPGTFPEQMSYFETDGMILFMQPQAVDNPLQVFDMMVACADTLFKELGGEILNDQHQPVTQDYLEQHRRWLTSS